jgi:hypothetical protein
MRVLALILSLMAAPHQPQVRHSTAMLLDWIAAVREHQAGESDRVLSTITAWTYDDLVEMRPLLETLVDAPTKNHAQRVKRRSRVTARDMEAVREALTFRGVMDFDTFRRRAAILHTDAALLGDPPAVTHQPMTDDVQKGGWHKLAVKVNRSGARVRARPGYQG